jgi:lipoate-protein ligase A
VSWAVQRIVTTAEAFHGRPIPEQLTRQVWVCDPTGPALVLGSTQPMELVDREACAEAGVAVVRRRSGGGAVCVVPGEVVWVDLLLPVGDPLWDDDVGAAFAWVGDAWVGALADLGIDAVAHPGPLRRSRWSDVICFAGVGPGEVTVRERKVVGISQRRARAGARFQCAALLRWDVDRLLGLLRLSDDERSAARRELAGAAAGLEAGPDDLTAALLRNLP